MFGCIGDEGASDDAQGHAVLWVVYSDLRRSPSTYKPHVAWVLGAPLDPAAAEGEGVLTLVVDKRGRRGCLKGGEATRAKS